MSPLPNRNFVSAYKHGQNPKNCFRGMFHISFALTNLIRHFDFIAPPPNACYRSQEVFYNLY